MRMRSHVALDVYDYASHKVCALYDSAIDSPGQAYKIVYTQELSGWKELEFTMPRVLDDEQNYRWDFIRAEYKICLTIGELREWFIIRQPKRVRNASSITNTVQCDHVCANLKTKGVYLTFDDENGIGTIDELAEKILIGTGWNLRHCDTLYENDGETEKIRSLKSDSKKGAYQLIADLCTLFDARPVFDGNEHAVDLYAMEDRWDLREMEIGKDIVSLTSSYNSENIVTRLYVEGQYEDDGYVGIDSVNPTGLSFLLNFDYYKDIGLFNATHEFILQRYIEDASQIKAEISQLTDELTVKQNRLNTLWGQFDYVMYCLSNRTIVKEIYGGNATADDAPIVEGDEIIICDGVDAFRKETAGTGGSISWQNSDKYALKYVTKSAGLIGSREVSLEAKQAAFDQAEEKYEEATEASSKAVYLRQMQEIHHEMELVQADLEDLMNEALPLRADIEVDLQDRKELLEEQSEIEDEFVVQMGDILKDGYWSDKNYIAGQEQFLYNDAVKILQELSYPEVRYTVSRVSLTKQLGYELDDFSVNTQVRIYDPLIGVNDLVFIKKIQLHLDEPDKDTVELSNESITVSGKSLDAVLQRVTALATSLDQKQSLYDRAKAINNDGNIYMERLEGTIDLMRTKLISAVSSWYTDDQGNIMFEDADGQSAMKLCGDGFMIAAGKNDDGSWNWRTFGTGKGFSADMIVTGFLSAGCIEAGSITTNKLSPTVGQTLDITGNTTITTMQGDIANNRTAIQAITPAYIVQSVQASDTFVEYDDVSDILDEQDWANGQNLLRDTSSDPTLLSYATGQNMVQISETVTLDTLHAASDHLTFRAYIDASNSVKDFAAAIEMNNTIYQGNTITRGTSGWSRVTVEIPASAQTAKAYIAKLTSGAETGLASYHSAKLEYGEFATPWNPVSGDIVSRLRYAEQKIDPDSIRATVFSAEEWSGNVKSSMSDVTQTVNSLTYSFIEQTTVINNTSDIANGLQEWKQTWYTMDANAMIIGKSNSNASLRIANDSIRFINGDDTVAEITGNQITINNSVFWKTMRIGNLMASIDGSGDNITWTWV